MKNVVIFLANLMFVFLIFSNSLKAQSFFDFNEQDIFLEPGVPLEGDLYIKLYLIALKPDSGTGGWTDADFDQFQTYLNEIYGGKNIFFNICFIEIKDSYWYDQIFDRNVLIQFISSNNLDFEDGIRGVVGVTGESGIEGESMGLLQKLFYASTDPMNAIHELGHSVGLLHPHDGAYSEDAPYYDINNDLQYGENADTTGDKVFDTPADRTPFSLTDNIFFDIDSCKFKNLDSLKDSKDHVYIDPEGYLVHNIMAYYNDPCRSLITPGQGIRIRGLISQIDEVLQTQKYKTVFTKDFFINALTNWINKDLVINGNVYLNNSRLNISNSLIYFTPGHKINVLAGTELLVSHSTLGGDLSSSCFASTGTTWEGIVCDYTNTVLTGTTLVELWYSNLENADCGIKTYGVNGISNLDLLITSSTFTGNRRALELINADGFIEILHSNFYYNRVGEANPLSHLVFNNSKAWISDCDIMNQNSSATGLTFYGIQSINSDLSVNSDNNIENWREGIYRGSGAAKIMSIVGTYFRNNKLTDLNSNRKYSNFLVLGNHFLNNTFKSADLKDLNTDLEIIGNNFESSKNGLTFKGYSPDSVQAYYYGNRFSDILYKGINFSNTDNVSHAPIFLCNNMNNAGNSADHILTTGGINPRQATKTINGQLASAGNIFTSLAQGHYNFTATAPGVLYYWKATNEEPKNYFGITLKKPDYDAICSANVFKDDPKDYDPGDGTTAIEEADWNDKTNEKDIVVTTINTSLDGGNTQVVITLINNANAANAEQVTQYLTGLGPWLSEEAAVAFTAQSGVFTGNQIVSVLGASPDVFANYIVNQFAFGPNSPLNANQQAQLRTAAAQTTERTRLLSVVDKLNAEINHTIAKAIHKITFTTDGSKNYCNLRMWTSRKGTFSSRLDLAELYFWEGNYNQSIDYLTDMLSDRTLTSVQINDVIQYRAIMTMLKSVYLDRRYEGTLTNAEKDALVNISNTGQLFSQDKARGILEYYYGYEFEELIPRAVEPGKFDKPAPESGDAIVNISPNPNNGSFEIEVIDWKSSLVVVQVYDMTGKTLFERKYETGIKKVHISRGVLQSGSYLYKVTSSDGRSGKGKILIE